MPNARVRQISSERLKLKLNIQSLLSKQHLREISIRYLLALVGPYEEKLSIAQGCTDLPATK